MKIIQNGKQCLKCLKSNENFTKSGFEFVKRVARLFIVAFASQSASVLDGFNRNKTSKHTKTRLKLRSLVGRRGENIIWFAHSVGIIGLFLSLGLLGTHEVCCNSRRAKKCEPMRRWYESCMLCLPINFFYIIQSTVAFTYLKREREKCKLPLVIDITVYWIKGIPNLARKTLKVSSSCSSIAKNPLHKLKNLQHIAECIKTFCTFSAILCAAFSPENFSRLAGSARFLCCSLADQQKETGLF